MRYSVKDLKILYEDNHLLAIDKPAGLLTQPNQTEAPNLEDLAKSYIKKKYHKKGNVFLHPIHRLDKPVSGIVLFARTSKALSRLNSQMRARQIKKIYAAKVEGHFEKKTGELCHQLSHGSHRATVKKTTTSKEAILSYTVKKEYVDSTLLLIQLYTGRYHQIRAQLSHIKHPILGDIKYGATQKSSRLALHHTQLIFHHPITREVLTIKSKLFKKFSCS